MCFYKITDVDSDYICPDNLLHIDAYFAHTDQGKTVAVVDLDTMKVIPIRNKLMSEPLVVEAIENVKREYSQRDKDLKQIFSKVKQLNRLFIEKNHGVKGNTPEWDEALVEFLTSYREFLSEYPDHILARDYGSQGFSTVADEKNRIAERQKNMPTQVGV